jgi:pantothenate kinase type III
MKQSRPTTPHHVIAIDIGNTNTRIGLVDVQRLACLKRRSVPTAGAVTGVAAIIGRLARPDVPVVVASVVPRVSARLVADLRTRRTGRVTALQYHAEMGLRVPYKHPNTLGIDRLADLLYAQAARPGKDTIVVDAGTAITIDYLRKGRDFVGGVIMPGAALQLAALNRGTSELPIVRQQAARFPGTSTESCIAAGVDCSIAGGVAEVVAQLRKKFDSRAVVLVTGGAWKAAVASGRFPCTHIPDLTLVGTALGGV